MVGIVAGSSAAPCRYLLLLYCLAATFIGCLNVTQCDTTSQVMAADD